mmetsp:Transcript_134146/g.286870  ORF Transcript_134146/g.286870 Transcript_134146/m.286870 type:complete len:260 (-) Transcript_134146:349-1128(-)
MRVMAAECLLGRSPQPLPGREIDVAIEAEGRCRGATDLFVFAAPALFLRRPDPPPGIQVRMAVPRFASTLRVLAAPSLLPHRPARFPSIETGAAIKWLRGCRRRASELFLRAAPLPFGLGPRGRCGTEVQVAVVGVAGSPAVLAAPSLFPDRPSDLPAIQPGSTIIGQRGCGGAAQLSLLATPSLLIRTPRGLPSVQVNVTSIGFACSAAMLTTIGLLVHRPPRLPSNVTCLTIVGCRGRHGIRAAFTPVLAAPFLFGD